MSTTVKNIRKSKHPVSKETIALCKKLGVEKFIPRSVPFDMSFELHNTTTEMANAIRRCINSEIPVLALNFENSDVKTDDSFIIIHELKKRIGLMPIRQISESVFSLNVKNLSDVIIPVYSSSIRETVKPNTTVKDEMFTGTNILTYLRPGKSLIISKITTKTGICNVDGPCFSFPGKVGFSCIDLEKMEYDELKKNGKINNMSPVSSMDYEASSYRLSISRQKHIDPAQIVRLGLKTLSDRTSRLLKLVKQSTGDTYNLDIEITNSSDHTLFKIFGETYTIGNLICKYGLMVDKTMPNIHCIKLHPTFENINIYIYHSDPKEIMIMTLQNILKELSAIKSFF